MDRYPAAIRTALEAMAAANVPPALRAPPLHRLLWRMGLPVPPPLLAGFVANFLLMGIVFGVLWGGLMALLFARIVEIPTGVMAGGAVFAGVLFGLLMALLMQHQQRRYRLPAWRTLRDGGR